VEIELPRRFNRLPVSLDYRCNECETTGEWQELEVSLGRMPVPGFSAATSAPVPKKTKKPWTLLPDAVGSNNNAINPVGDLDVEGLEAAQKNIRRRAAEIREGGAVHGFADSQYGQAAAAGFRAAAGGSSRWVAQETSGGVSPELKQFYLLLIILKTFVRKVDDRHDRQVQMDASRGGSRPRS
jgi:hypothetical protein